MQTLAKKLYILVLLAVIATVITVLIPTKPANACDNCYPDVFISCTVDKTSINSGQTVNYTTHVTGGGTGFPYEYQWSGAVSGSGTSKSATYTSAGSKSVSVSVTNTGQTKTAQCPTVTVNTQAEALVTSCTMSRTEANVGESVTWSAHTTGGTGGYTYVWTSYDGLSGTGNPISKIYTTPGQKNAFVVVRSGDKEASARCGPVTVTAVANPLVVSCSANQSSVKTGDTVIWSANVSGGSGSYSYSWNGSDGLSGSGASKSKTYSSTGTKTASVTVTSDGATKSADCGSVSVDTDTSDISLSCSPDRTSANTGDSVRWTAYPSGGSGSYSYSWSGTDDLSGSGSSQTKSYSSSGSKTASVTVTSGSKTKTANCGYVSVGQTDQSLTGSCTVSNSNIQKNNSVTWSASASGGSGSYSYSWSGDYPLSGRSGNNTSVYYDSTGYKYGTVTITSGSQSITRSCGPVYVSDSNNSSLDVSCSVNNSNINIGDQVYVSAYGSGGDGSYSYTWGGDYPLSGRTGSNQYVTYNSSGDKEVRVTMYSNGNQVNRYCGTVHVRDNYNYNYNNNYSDLNLTCNVSNSSASIGQTVTWNTSASGGNGSYYYTWSGTDNLYGSNSSVSNSFSTTGIKNASVTVNSGGYSRSLNCPSVSVLGGTAYYQNPNQGNLASLSSVYLNQVPYTGVGDSPKFIAFIIGLILWSGAMAYAIVYRRIKTERKNKILDFKRENMSKRGLL